MSGRRFGPAGEALGGRVPGNLRALPPGSDRVPILGAKPHEVRLQVVSSDGKPPTVIELAANLAALLVQVTNWASPIDQIRNGVERQARMLGDPMATVELLRVLDGARASVLEIQAAVKARREGDAARAVEEANAAREAAEAKPEPGSPPAGESKPEEPEGVPVPAAESPA